MQPGISGKGLRISDSPAFSFIHPNKPCKVHISFHAQLVGSPQCHSRGGITFVATLSKATQRLWPVNKLWSPRFPPKINCHVDRSHAYTSPSKTKIILWRRHLSPSLGPFLFARSICGWHSAARWFIQLSWECWGWELLGDPEASHWQVHVAGILHRLTVEPWRFPYICHASRLPASTDRCSSMMYPLYKSKLILIFKLTSVTQMMIIPFKVEIR